MKKDNKIIRYHLISAMLVLGFLVLQRPRTIIGMLFLFILYGVSSTFGVIYYKHLAEVKNKKTVFIASVLIYLTTELTTYKMCSREGLLFILKKSDTNTFIFSSFILGISMLGGLFQYLDYTNDDEQNSL
jgi:hypothetical protein